MSYALSIAGFTAYSFAISAPLSSGLAPNLNAPAVPGAIILKVY